MENQPLQIVAIDSVFFPNGLDSEKAQSLDLGWEEEVEPLIFADLALIVWEGRGRGFEPLIGANLALIVLGREEEEVETANRR